MTDKKDRYQNKEQQPADIINELTAAGDPLPIDPETGDIIESELTDAQRQELAQAARKLAAVYDAVIPKSSEIKKMLQSIAGKTIANLQTDKMRDLLELLQQETQPTIDFIHELQGLEPFIKREEKRGTYNGLTFEKIMDYTPGELRGMLDDPKSDFARLIQAARAAKQEHDERVEPQNAGRKQRKKIKEAAQETGAIMEIRGGNYVIFSEEDLWGAFTPKRIVKMGETAKKYIGKDGKLNEYQIAPGDIETIRDPAKISLRAMLLLTSIIKNSVDDPEKTPLENTTFYKDSGKLRFYVKGVIDAIQNDARSLLKTQAISDDQQLDINRKTAGALYLEKLFEPLQGYLGTMENGSRWAVFNYVGYDAETDIMTVQTPYLYQIWLQTQGEYFTRIKNKQQREQIGKKPLQKDSKPLAINFMFKGSAYNEDQTILEIACYITNKMLQAGGKKGEIKTHKTKYITIINQCPRIKAALEEIENAPIKTYTDKNGKERKTNKNALYNTELRKIARAFDIIQNPDECDAFKYYEFLSINPAELKRDKYNNIKAKAPTKSTLSECMVIKWRKLYDDEKL